MYGGTIKTNDCIEIARSCIHAAAYNWFHEHSDPPHVVNCYTFVQWVFCEVGIFLPQSLFGQLQKGSVVPPPYQKGDIVFTKGRWEGLGHNGIFTDSSTVIHASQDAGTVVEESFADFLSKRKLRSVVRIAAEPP